MPLSVNPALLPPLPADVAPAGGAGASGQATPAKLKKVCQDMESVFIYKLLQSMRSTVPQEGYLHGSGEDVYYSICDQQVATSLAKGRGIGLSDMLYRQMSGRRLVHPGRSGAAKAYQAAGQATSSEPHQDVDGGESIQRLSR